MIRINLLKDDKSVIHKKISAITLLAALAVVSTTSCTTLLSSKRTNADGTIVDASGTGDGDAANQQDIPPELRNADQFDPAMTLDPKVVQESDFYQIKKTIQQNKEAMESAWKEQEAVEARVKEATSAESQRKAALAKQEEEERDRKRQMAAEEYERTKDQRAKEEEDADRRVKKMPTINRAEERWNGLED